MSPNYTSQGKVRWKKISDVGISLEISSRELKPSLSVDLLGDWGSGKSFFMNKIHEEVEANLGWAKQKVNEHVNQLLEALGKLEKEGEITQKNLDLFSDPKEKYEQIKDWIRTQPALAYDDIAQKFYENPAEGKTIIQQLTENPAEAKEETLNPFLNNRQKHQGETTAHRMYQHFEQLSVYDILDQVKTDFRFSFRFDEN